MRETRAAIADNLRALFPGRIAGGARAPGARHAARLRQRRDRLHPRRCDAPTRTLPTLFDYTPARRASCSYDLLAQGRGIILVSGHYGNWEIGSVFMRRVVNLPLAIVAMAEADPEVNRLRREIRDSLGADTIRSRPVARHRAADPPAAGRQPHRRVADGSAHRPRSRRGRVSRPARVVSQRRRR